MKATMFFLGLALLVAVAVEAAPMEEEMTVESAARFLRELTDSVEVETRKLKPCADCCYDGRSETAKALCCVTFGGLC